MRELDFSDGNLRNRWLGVNHIWAAIQGEVLGVVKREVELILRAEVTAQVGCERYERNGERTGYRNGSYARDLLTTYGWISSLRVPRVRTGRVSFSLLARYRRRQRLVDQVLLETFLLGCATRKTRRVCRRVFGAEISPQAISNLVAQLDDEVAAFHRRLVTGAWRVVYLDGLWLTFRTPVKVKKVLLVALGVDENSNTKLLGFQLAASESEACWWGFLADLKARGLSGSSLEVMVSDGGAGLVKAVTALFPRVKHQRCTFHKAMDVGTHLTHRCHRSRIIADALHVFAGATQREVGERIRAFADRWSISEPRAVRNFLKGIDDCLIYLEYPDPWRTKLKTNNPLERYLEELRRRTIPMRAFANRKSAERIIYGIIAYVLNSDADMPETQFTQRA